MIHQFDNLLTGGPRSPLFIGKDRRDGCRAEECHAYGFSQDLHGIGGAHNWAGPRARAGTVFHLTQVFLRNVVDGERAEDSLVNVGGDHCALAVLAGKHRTAGDHDRRKVYPCRSHQFTGNNAVARGKQDEPIKEVNLGHDLD